MIHQLVLHLSHRKHVKRCSGYPDPTFHVDADLDPDPDPSPTCTHVENQKNVFLSLMESSASRNCFISFISVINVKISNILDSTHIEICCKIFLFTLLFV
jgi:hypothetical protein